MKKLFLIAIISALFLQVHSQSWQSSNRLISGEEVVSIASDSDDDANIYVYGYFTLTLSASSGESVTSYGGRDYFIAKFDSLSNVLWLHNLGSTGNDYVGGGMEVADDGSVYVTGGFRNEFFYTPALSITSTGGFDTFILKYDADGNVVWIKHSGQGPGNQRPNSLATDDTGNLLISGFFTDTINFDGEEAFKSITAIDDFYYAKFNQLDGGLTWAKQCAGIDNPGSGRITAIEAETGSYSFAGLFLDSISIGQDTLVSDAIDAFIMKTDLDGNVNWIRQVSGANDEYTYTIQKEDTGSGDLFLSGFFSSTSLIIDSTASDQIMKDVQIGGFDIMVLKYASDGTFQWIIAEGGTSTDKVWDITTQDSFGIITGSFTDSMYWGGIQLIAQGGAGDVDMFIAQFSSNGELLGANSYAGRFDSREEGRGVFENNGKTYTVLRSDSDLLVLGDSSYISSGGVFYLAVGVIGCQTVNVDFVNPTDLTCYNDSTGSLVIIASGGFGGPYQYSIDNGESYYENNGLFNNLPALDYQIKVTDNQNCIGDGPSGSISQPDSIQFTYTVSDPACSDDVFGSIEFDIPTGGSNSGWLFSTDSGMSFLAEALFEDLAVDTFYLLVKEDMDCESAIIDTMLVLPDSLTYEFESLKDSLSCFGDTDGEIRFKNFSGGSGTLEFSIDQVIFISDTFFLGLGADDYSLLIRDANNCLSFVTDTSIYEPEELTIALIDSSNVDVDNPGTIEVLASGGTPGYKYTLQPDGIEQFNNGYFEISAAGVYSVDVVDTLLCGPVSSIDVILIHTWIDENDLVEAKVYPNPTDGQITIQMKNDKPECLIEVLSLTGQVVISRNTYTNGGELNEVMDLSHLSSGMYILIIDGKALRSGIVVN